MKTSDRIALAGVFVAIISTIAAYGQWLAPKMASTSPANTSVPPTNTSVLPANTSVLPANTPVPPETVSHLNVHTMDTAWSDGALGFTFVRVPASEFIFGVTQSELDYIERLCREHPDPGHCERSQFLNEPLVSQQYLDEFWISQNEVSNQQFQVFIEANGYETKQYWSDEGWIWKQKTENSAPRLWQDLEYNASNQPVVGISWYEAEAFSNWLSAQLEKI